MSSRSRSSSRQSKVARALLVLMLLMLRVPDAFRYYHTFDLADPSPRLRIYLVVMAVWTTVLWIMVWFRKRWAKYLLAVFLALGAICDMVTISAVFSEHDGGATGRMIAVTAHAVMYFGAATMLLLSRSIRRLADRL